MKFQLKQDGDYYEAQIMDANGNVLASASISRHLKDNRDYILAKCYVLECEYEAGFGPNIRKETTPIITEIV